MNINKTSNISEIYNRDNIALIEVLILLMIMILL